jgi:hypothetical protein
MWTTQILTARLWSVQQFIFLECASNVCNEGSWLLRKIPLQIGKYITTNIRNIGVDILIAGSFTELFWNVRLQTSWTYNDATIDLVITSSWNCSSYFLVILANHLKVLAVSHFPHMVACMTIRCIWWCHRPKIRYIIDSGTERTQVCRFAFWSLPKPFGSDMRSTTGNLKISSEREHFVAIRSRGWFFLVLYSL